MLSSLEIGDLVRKLEEEVEAMEPSLQGKSLISFKSNHLMAKGTCSEFQTFFLQL